jgi:hypothetical protein
MEKSDNKSKKKKKTGTSSNNNNGPSQSNFNVNASLLRLEKKYDELVSANAKTLQKEFEEDGDILTTEYVIAVRCPDVVNDWIPVAQLIVGRTTRISDSLSSLSSLSSCPLEAVVKSSISLYRRELCHVANLGSKIFQSAPRNNMQYSMESADSFYKHVYQYVVEGNTNDGEHEENPNSNKQASSSTTMMSKAVARKILQLDDHNHNNLHHDTIKARYRELSFRLHPDRFVGMLTELATTDNDDWEEKKASAAQEFARVKSAYEALSSGVRRNGVSWYESLGSRARTDFVGPIPLETNMETAREAVEATGHTLAIVGLDPMIVQSFVARNQASNTMWK